ncbi:helix-turn-helix domain-containing protein [Enterococcus sp. LJL120]
MFAEIFKKHRLELGLTQQQAADQFHVTRQTISNWENGHNFPDTTTLLKISDVFEISLDYLLKGDQALLKTIQQREQNYSLSQIRLRFGFIGSFLYNRFSQKTWWQKPGYTGVLFAAAFLILYGIPFFILFKFISTVSNLLLLIVFLLSIFYGWWANDYLGKRL